MQLYKIDDQIQQLLDSANILTGEIDATAFDALTLDRAIKQEGVLLFTRGLEMDIDTIDTEIKRLKAIKDTLERKAEWLKAYLKSSMEKFNENELHFGVHFAAIKKNPVSLVVHDGDIVPPKYKVIITEERIDKMKIKEDMKNGIEVKGVELVTNTRLEIK